MLDAVQVIVVPLAIIPEDLFAEQFVPEIVTLQYPGEAETEPGTAADLLVVSFNVLPPKDQLSLAVKVVDLLLVTAYHPLETFAVEFVAVTV